MWILSKQQNQIIYWLLLLYTATFVIWGNFFITTSSILLSLMWILEGNYRAKFRRLTKRNSPLFFIAIYLVITLWGIRELPNKEAARDIWENLPLLIFALVIGSKEQITNKQFHSILLAFIFSLVIQTIFSFIYFLFTADSNVDVREVSIFMSYIRLTLYTLIALASTGYYLFLNSKIRISIKEQIFLWFSLFWLIFFVIILSSITGYIGLGLLFFIFSLFQIKKQKHIILKILPISLIIIFFWIIGNMFIQELRYFTHPDDLSKEKIETKTLLGNDYRPFNHKGSLENGHWTNLYVCDKEMFENWKSYSKIPIGGKDAKTHPIYSTLKRYMTSKNLRKDASGLKQLSREDIRLVELGCTNYRFPKKINISHRIYEVFWEFQNYFQGNNPAGHSVTQRIEFLKCSYKVFKKNFWFGTGAASVMTSLDQQYQNQRVSLPKQYWKKPHNEFMLFAVQYGIFGLTIFCISLLGIIIFARKNISILTMSWIFICGISFLNEDTLDGINGLVFFSFLGCLFLYAQPFYREKNL